MPDPKYSNNTKVKLIAYTYGKEEYGPDEISAFGALGCFEEKTPSQLYEELSKEGREKIEEKSEKVINASIGRGHGSVADQNAFVFEIEDISRAGTLLLCSFNYLSHLQQSLRRANADRGYELPESILSTSMAPDVISVLDVSFKLYEDMIREGIPHEDARYILPLYTRTNIQTLGDARELTHLHYISQLPLIPSTVKIAVERMIEEASKIAPKLFKKRKMNYEPLAWYPAPQIYSENKTMKDMIKENKEPEKATLIKYDLKDETIMKAIIDKNEAEMANLKHLHNGSQIEGFLVPMSIVTLHQVIRQRTWDQSTESIYDAAERGKFIIPESINNTKFFSAYQIHSKDMIQLYNNLVSSGIQKNDAIGVIPHSVIIYDLIHINGWNAINAIGKRMCTEAQWEIRKIAEDVAREIVRTNPKLFSYLGPQCKIYGICPEKKPCNKFKKGLI